LGLILQDFGAVHFSRSRTASLILVKKKKKSYAIPSTLVIMAAVDLFFSWQYFKSD